MRREFKVAVLMVAVLMCVSYFAGCGNSTSESSKSGYHTVVDMRGTKVRVPDKISRVIDISDGFTTSVMYSFGVADKVVGLGSDCLKDVDDYSYPTVSGGDVKYENGMYPVSYLSPLLRKLPAVAKYEEAVNLETIAKLNPDLIVIRKGFGSMCTAEYGTEQDIQKNIKLIENLGFPTVVLYGPPCYKKPSVETIYKEITVLGDAFNKQEDAKSLNAYLKDTMEMVRKRTAGVTASKQPRVLFLGLSPNARDSGGAGDVLGTDTIESSYLSDLIHAKNAFSELAGWKMMNTEQILTLNPDAIVLPTDWGYHPAEEIYTAPYYQNLQELGAVKNKKVSALPYMPYNTAKALEFPIEVMVTAKAAYPNLFKDVELSDWVLDFYKNVYHVNAEQAEGCRSAQWMDWTVKENQ